MISLDSFLPKKYLQFQDKTPFHLFGVGKFYPVTYIFFTGKVLMAFPTFFYLILFKRYFSSIPASSVGRA
jgi:hypothetical protein